ARLHRRRADRDARRDALASARLRAVPRAGGEDPSAVAEPPSGADRLMIVRERPAAGGADGALVLFHGRGADENDLFPLLDALDPERRLDGYCPRGPLSLPPGGAHWYVVPRVGFPDPDTFWSSYNEVAAWLDALPHDRLVLGGFSQGCVMALALGLG